MGNVFRTEEEALKQVELTKAIVRVRQYIAENCEEFEPDWVIVTNISMKFIMMELVKN